MSDELRVSGIWRKLTKADSDIPRVGGLAIRALYVGTAGTANLMDGSGAIATDFPLQAGLNPIRPAQVRTGGTADDIWALY
jgi:hypothetical protein